MIARLKAWFHFDAETFATTASALSALSGVPIQFYDLRTEQEASQEAAEPAVATTVGG